MAVMKMSLLVLIVLSGWFSVTESSRVDPACAAALTHNDTHKHLKAYIGYVSGDIIGVHTDKTYKYRIGICVEPDPDNARKCGIVQYEDKVDVNGTHRTKTYCIGKITNSQVTETNDHVWVELTYSNGQNYGSHCGKEPRKGRIVFLCDPLISGKGHIQFLEENRDDDICYYLFTIASKQVCGSQLTPGDIILIIMAFFVVLWMVAMILGFLYKRFFLGSKGFEQVPLINIYREFGNLEADGCDLVCRSGESVPPSRYKPPAPPFSAETDEETDEEKDDNLLPM